jgi:hypothetical protein
MWQEILVSLNHQGLGRCELHGASGPEYREAPETTKVIEGAAFVREGKG